MDLTSFDSNKFINCTASEILNPRIPEILKLFADLENKISKDVSKKCLVDFVDVFRAISALDFQALRLIDSWGKIPAGILDGNLKSWGRSDECLKTVIRISDEKEKGNFLTKNFIQKF